MSDNATTVWLAGILAGGFVAFVAIVTCGDDAMRIVRHLLGMPEITEDPPEPVTPPIAREKPPRCHRCGTPLVRLTTMKIMGAPADVREVTPKNATWYCPATHHLFVQYYEDITGIDDVLTVKPVGVHDDDLT